jgi:hypothetical protein
MDRSDELGQVQDADVLAGGDIPGRSRLRLGAQPPERLDHVPHMDEPAPPTPSLRITTDRSRSTTPRDTTGMTPPGAQATVSLGTDADGLTVSTRPRGRGRTDGGGFVRASQCGTAEQRPLRVPTLTDERGFVNLHRRGRGRRTSAAPHPQIRRGRSRSLSFRRSEGRRPDTRDWYQLESRSGQPSRSWSQRSRPA